MLDPLFAEKFLHALDGHAVIVKKLADAPQKAHVRRPVISPPAGPLDRLDLTELAFPKPQHMCGNAKPVGHFADGAERVGGFAHLHLRLRPCCPPRPALSSGGTDEMSARGAG